MKTEPMTLLRTPTSHLLRLLRLLALSVAALASTVGHAQAATPAAVQALAAQQVQPVLDTLKELTAIESGSRDLEGLARLAEVVAARLRGAGMSVQLLPGKAPDFDPRFKGEGLGSMVYATRSGTGQRKVLLIAHMDTVYSRGMGAGQAFRIERDRAYGLGISDDKGGVAVVLHTVAMLEQMGFRDYAQLGVLINGDEEIGSPGSAAFITQLGSEYDAVLSFEGGGVQQDVLRLATSSLASVEMRVTGKASHAGANPEGGRNALYEMAHQILKSRQLDDPIKGLRLNWTMAHAGEVRNAIPAQALASADVRALSNDDLDVMERALRESIKDKLIAGTSIELAFHRGRPAWAGNASARAMARHAKAVFAEIGQTLEILERAAGGGTDAAFAGVRPKGGVLEGFGLRGYGAHSSSAEYIFIPSIAPRLYLATRMVMDLGSGALAW